MPGPAHQLYVDHSERQSALMDAVHRCGTFDVQMVRLATGDYLIDNEALIKRKTVGDFAASLIDGACSRRRQDLLTGVTYRFF